MLRQSDRGIALRLAATVDELALVDWMIAISRARGHDVGALRERRETLRKLRWRMQHVEHHRAYGRHYSKRYRILGRRSAA